MQRGFTLIELLVVTAAFILFGGMAMLRIGSWQERYEVDAASAQLAADVNWLRQLSLNSVDTPPVLFFQNVPPYGYFVVKNSMQLLQRRFSEQVVPGNYAASIAFDASGRPVVATDETIILKSARKRDIQGRIVIEPITGRVRTE